MSLIHTVTILICLAAAFSYVNHRFFRLPKTIGLMVISLVLSLVVVSLGTLDPGIENGARRFIRGIDFTPTIAVDHQWEATRHHLLAVCLTRSFSP